MFQINVKNNLSHITLLHVTLQCGLSTFFKWNLWWPTRTREKAPSISHFPLLTGLISSALCSCHKSLLATPHISQYSPTLGRRWSYLHMIIYKDRDLCFTDLSTNPRHTVSPLYILSLLSWIKRRARINVLAQMGPYKKVKKERDKGKEGRRRRKRNREKGKRKSFTN